MRKWSAVVGSALLVVSFGAATSALAEEEKVSKEGIPNPSIATSLPDKGDPDGVRASLAAKGVTYGINYIGEVWGNTGGLRQGATYDGRFEGILDADLEKLWGLKGSDLPRKRLSDPRRRSFQRKYRQFFACELDRGPSVHAALRNVS